MAVYECVDPNGCGYNTAVTTLKNRVSIGRYKLAEPGSAFKPVVYSAAVDKLDYTPSTIIDDKPFIRTDDNLRWKPSNAGQKFRGQLPMRTCLQDSINTPALRIADAVGIRDILRNAKRFGMQGKVLRYARMPGGKSARGMPILST